MRQYVQCQHGQLDTAVMAITSLLYSHQQIIPNCLFQPLLGEYHWPNLESGSNYAEKKKSII